MEHVTLAALVAVIAWLLFVREERLRRRIGELERRAVTAEADAGAKTQLATVGELVSGLARELKTPLQGVLGNTEVMLATDGSRTEELRDIHDHAARAADIVRNLIAFSETTVLARRWQDLNDVCARAIDVAQPQISAAGHSVQVSSGDRLPLVYVDGRQLEKAIGGLIGHAGAVRPSRRFLPMGAPLPPIAVSTRRADDMLIIDIDFPRVAKETVEHALAAGELDACRHVIRAHGGRLAIDSRRSGSGVTIELPAALVDVSSPASPSDAASQESSESWTRLSTSSTSTATGTSRS